MDDPYADLKEVIAEEFDIPLEEVGSILER